MFEKMNDPMINSLHLLTEASVKMARPRYSINGSKEKQRATDDNDSNKQQQPRKLITGMNSNCKNNNDKKRTTTSDSEDDIESIPNNNDNLTLFYSNQKSTFNKKKENENYNHHTNVRNKYNKRDKYDEEECDDDEEESDDIVEIKHKNTPQRVPNKKQMYYSHPVREQIMPEKDLSPTSSECLTGSTSSSYHNFVLENGQDMTSNDLCKQVEIIVKDTVWSQYKLPDDTDYQYNSRFSKIILHRLQCETKTMNRRGQEMWNRIVKMVKAEYQITRSTVTQSMKSSFFDLYLKGTVLQLSDIEKGRSNIDSSIYINFCNKYIPCVMGKVKFKGNCYSKALTKYCTVSDEAMAMLIYSNNFDQWLHMSKQKKIKTNKEEREKVLKDKENIASDTNDDEESSTDDFCKTKNIDVGEKPPQKYFLSQKGRGHTYSQQGYIYFNAMCSAIYIDRQNNGANFDEEFLKHMNDIVENGKDSKKGKRKKIKEEETLIRAYVEEEPGRGTTPLNIRLEYSNVPKTSV